jgi:hypothetical protein
MRLVYWITKASDRVKMCNTLIFHGNNVCMNAAQCYVRRTLPVLLVLPGIFHAQQARYSTIFLSSHSGKMTVIMMMNMMSPINNN